MQIGDENEEMSCKSDFPQANCLELLTGNFKFPVWKIILRILEVKAKRVSK